MGGIMLIIGGNKRKGKPINFLKRRVFPYTLKFFFKKIKKRALFLLFQILLWGKLIYL